MRTSNVIGKRIFKKSRNNHKLFLDNYFKFKNQNKKKYGYFNEINKNFLKLNNDRDTIFHKTNYFNFNFWELYSYYNPYTILDYNFFKKDVRKYNKKINPISARKIIDRNYPLNQSMNIDKYKNIIKKK